MTDEIQPKRGRGRPRGSKNKPHPDRPNKQIPADLDWNSHRLPAHLLDPRVKERLKPRQLAFVESYFRCRGAVNLACKEAGVASGTAHYWLREHKGVIDAIDSARKTVAVATEYNLSEAMASMDRAAAFAIETKNATALVRAEEMKAKLAGLMIERVDQRNIGGFVLNISGIDDEKPAKPESTYEDIFG